jgi:predicted MPP superfamily phosphohydrolase
MPVLLPQLSRREFLKRAALAAAAAGLAPSGYASLFGKPRDENLFVFFSDTHIAADAAQMFNDVNMTDHLTACVNELLAWPVAPVAVIISGDLAFRMGEPGDYTQFGQLIEPVRAVAPVHLMLGNHDQRRHFWDAFPRDEATVDAIPQKQAAVLSAGRVNWFLLDSLNHTNITMGKLGAAQLDWLDRELAARPDKPALIVCHHNLDQIFDIMGLEDTRALAGILKRRPQVKAFIYGHTHNWHVDLHKSGVQLVNLPPTGYVFVPGRPSGWVRAALKDDGVEVELRSLDRKHPEHAQLKQLAWR